MDMHQSRLFFSGNGRPIAAIATLTLASATFPVVAQKHYDDGASDAEIRVGTTTPMTGAFSEYSGETRAEAAYFKMINDQGGINGRKIVYIVRDDGSDQTKSPQLAQQLVEEDKVLLLFSTFGVKANQAIRDYANRHQVPQLFVQTASSVYNDPTHYPWTMGFFASLRTEGQAYARFILETKPDAKIGVLFADDDFGREYLAGLKEGLGDQAGRIVREARFRYSDPETIDAQVDALQGAGADVFVNLATGRAVTRAVRHAYDVGWRPLQLISNATLSAPQFLDPAGAKKAVGIISNARSKGWQTAASRGDAGVAEFLKWRQKYLPDDGPRDALNVAGYERAQALVDVLRRCGDDLTKANVMKQAASMDMTLGMLRPGIRITTSASDYQPIKELYLVRFDGQDWMPLRLGSSR
jgi:branched-chain amino acid transport system substrate-binding protein